MAEGLMLAEFVERLEALAEISPTSVAIGVADPEAALYARVLEYGSIAGQPPWPHPSARTVLAVDPDTGAAVVVSAQAPQGFIRVRSAEFLGRLRDELARPADWLNADEIAGRLREAAEATADAALEALRAAVPHDSDRLHASLQIIE